MAQVDDFLAEALPRWQRAYRALCGGDVEPGRPSGPPRTRSACSVPPDRRAAPRRCAASRAGVAGHFAGLVDEKQELIAAGACGDLAYTVAFEHKTVETPDGGQVTYTLRATHVFRREDGEWRIVHRHGDRPPERADFPVAPTSGTA